MNYKLLSFDHTKNMTFKGEMPLVDYNTLAMLTGKSLNIGSVNLPKREVLTANGSNQIILSSTPLAGTLKIYTVTGRDVGTEQIAGTPASQQNQYSISGLTVTLNSTTAPSGATFAASYSYASASTNKTTTFTADKFCNYVRILGTGLVTDQVSGALVPTVFDIKKAKAKNNWTITQKSTDATKLTLDFDLYAVAVGTDQVYLTMTALT